ncbi:F-box domain-containing protein [Mytilinidion resinicola]|uniref:F-box domain-containing protein n=1 Tax=Mytilinidion resinicola TaxID=574789 RepID=A0A6A6Z5A5_9PEZI|nr:F-box domain-containing protein [Mytilinidion resinicola]KAF2815843.1 F-box domain-containing protein [Mytilinidion resinicola]
MEDLPTELLLQIVAFLEPSDLVHLQYVSRRFLSISRENTLWKTLCFEHSVAEVRRRRQLLCSNMEPRLAELARALEDSPINVHGRNAPSADMEVHRTAARQKATLLANWDPSYPEEKVNFYQDFIQRHAPHTMSWFQNAQYGHREQKLHHEATGMGILFDDAGHLADKLVAPLEDGSVCIWDASKSSERQGAIIGRSSIGLLSDKGSDLDLDTRINQSKTIMTETGAVECVSIDSRRRKGFFAVQNILNEVDLYTLQVISRTPFPFPITALSEARHPTPLTVGTNWTLHLHDTRKAPPEPDSGSSTKCELIAGTPSKNDFLRLQTGDFGGHVSLSQPGALSILHLPTAREWDGNGDIWVGGRFTSFLNYDRRFFPRLRGTVHSGARLSCITAIPHPFIPADLRLRRHNPSSTAIREAKSIPGHTLIAAGEYKGKGSLELYSLSSDPVRSINSSDSRATRNQNSYYHNRQTASSSKLLSVAPHGTRLVFSDGDGNMKWVERDGFTPVRQLNINSDGPAAQPLSALSAEASGDIVQKISPTVASSYASHSEVPLGEDNLIIWTGDGKLGMVEFGRSPAFNIEDVDEQAQAAQEMEQAKKEREYGQELRRALERQAAELRWMRGYGLR